MTRKILYIIATAWVLAFISQTYAHAADQWSYFECKSPFYRYTEISFGEDYGGSATIFTNFAVTHTTKGWHRINQFQEYNEHKRIGGNFATGVLSWTGYKNHYEIRGIFIVDPRSTKRDYNYDRTGTYEETIFDKTGKVINRQTFNCKEVKEAGGL